MKPERSEEESAALGDETVVNVDPADTNGSEQDHRAQRGRRQWLRFTGTRHPRVGNEYQVTALPEPSAAASETTNGSSKLNGGRK